MKFRNKFLQNILLLAACAALFSSCALREEEILPEKPEEAPRPTLFTVSYYAEGTLLTTETVPKDAVPGNAPEYYGERSIIDWQDRNGAVRRISRLPICEDAAYYAVFGAALLRQGGYLAAREDGLFHPLESFTRGDAVRAVYAMLEDKPEGELFLRDVTTRASSYKSACALISAGYISTEANGCFYPDRAITKDELTALLSHIFAPAAVEREAAAFGDTFLRFEAAELINALLMPEGAHESAVFADVSPERPYYDAVMLAGSGGEALPEPGFVLREGRLYYARDDGRFLCDGMVGTLYFDASGRYTSGDEALDGFVSEALRSHTEESMTRMEKLRAVYEYVRDRFLYMKRNTYSPGETGWEVSEALTMFRSGKGNCYNFTGAFWALARGLGYDAVCRSGRIGAAQDPHSWVEIAEDGEVYIYDPETEMSCRLVNDTVTSLYRLPRGESEKWNYTR